MPRPAKRGKRTYEVIDLTGSSPPPKRIASSQTAHRVPTSSDRETWSSQPSFQNSLPSARMLRTEDHDGDDLEILDLTQDDETSAWEFYGTLDVMIVGVRYYNGYVTPGEVAICRREPGNPYDSNAVRVDNILGNQIGHLPRTVVSKLAPYLDRNELMVEARVNGEKGAFDCPIKLLLYGTSNSAARRDLEKKLKADKLLKATELNNTRKEAENQRVAMELKSSRSTAGLGEQEEVSLTELLRDSQTVNFRMSGDAINTLVLSEDNLAKMPMADQPEALEAQLLPYQLQGLTWMKAKEKPCHPVRGSEDVVQLWKCNTRGDYYNIATNYRTASKPDLFSGGILADDMGLGKTLQIIALILTGGSGPTLIVAPMGVMSNWEQQITKHVKKSHQIRVLTYHGAQKQISATKDFGKYDVVITSYGKLNSPSSLLQSVSWRRIVLDEGHTIRNPKTQVARAACLLKAQSRWVLTGTPIINSVKDLQSLVKFLGIKGGVEDPHTFSQVIERPLRSGHASSEALLQALIQDICLRRKKDMKFVFLELPTKTEYVHRITFHRKEKVKYDALLSDARGHLKEARERAERQSRGQKLNKGNFPTVLELLLRLRQMCNHWALCKDSVEDVLRLLEGHDIVTFTDENRILLQKALQVYIENQEDCPVCMDNLEDPVITNCKHIFCTKCINQVIEIQHKCPMCRNELKPEFLLGPAPETSEEVAGDFDTETKSSKTEALLKILQATLKNKGSKVVVFSQWTSFLNIIQQQLTDAGYKFTRLDGTMSKPKRDAAVHALDNDPNTRIMLASLSVCSVGLNLVAADTVVLADSWWAPAIEDQAIDRVHRIGQKRETKIWRLVMENSVEDRVLDIQAEKRTLVNKAFQEKGKANKSQETRMGDIIKLLA